MPDENDVIKVAKKRDKFLNSSITNHQRRLTESIKELENNIINRVKDFKTTDGMLVGPRVNMKQAQKIHSQLTKMFDETYGREAREVVKGFTKASKYIQREFDSLELSSEFTSVDKDMIKTLKKSTWENFNQFGLATQKTLVDTMYKGILSRTSFADMVKNFQGALSGHKDAKGRPMSTYANLYANDAIMNFHNSVTLKKASDIGMKYFMYYGSLITTSRDFCIQRAGKVFSREVIDSWDYHWGGKSGPAMTSRGGYNCRHSWVPVRKKWLGKDTEVIDKIEEPLRKKGLAAELKPSEKLPAEVRAKMTKRQLTALDNYVPSDLKSRTIAEEAERRLADGVGADHIIGKRPFDYFLDNEFVENKTFVQGRGQIRMRPSSKKKKLDFMKRYKVRGHTVAVDMREGSETYGKMFYRKGLGDFRPETMTEVKDYDHLQELLKKGSRKMPELRTAYRTKVPTAKNLKAAENYARNKIGIADIDYDEINKKAGDLLNRYIGGMVDELGVTPKAVLFDDSMFVKGAARNYAAIASEDGTLYLNRKMFKTTDKILELSKQQFRVGQFTTASEGHIIRHEVGHLKYFDLGGTEMSAKKKLTKRMLADLKQVGPENLPRYVSKYGLKSQGEFYAEMVAKRLNGERLHPICERIMADIEVGLKKMKRVARKARKIAAEVVEKKTVTGRLLQSIEDVSSIEVADLNKAIATDFEAGLGKGFKIKPRIDVFKYGEDLPLSVLEIESGGNYAGHIRYSMDMSTGELYLEDIYIEDAFRGKGISSKIMNQLDRTAEEIGNRLGVDVPLALDAEDMGRYVWGKFGYKVDADVMKKIKKFGKEVGVTINDERDFVKLKKWFDADAEGLPGGFSMRKTLKSGGKGLAAKVKKVSETVPSVSELNLSKELQKDYKTFIKAVEDEKKIMKKRYPEFVKDYGGKGAIPEFYTPKQVERMTGRVLSAREKDSYNFIKSDIRYFSKKLQGVVDVGLKEKIVVNVKKGSKFIWSRSNDADVLSSQLESLGLGTVKPSEFRNTKKLKKVYNSVGDEMVYMRNKFPGLRFTEKRKLSWFEVASGKGDDGITASYYHKDKGMEIFGQSTSIKRKRLFLGKRRGYFSENGIFGDFRHEYGHHVQIQMAKDKSLKKYWSEFKRIHKKLGGDEAIGKLVTSYAGDNVQEAFAECFAIFTDPIYGTRKAKRMLPKELHNFFTKLLL